MAFIIPLWISATLGVGFPGHGTFATPFVVTAPRRFRSTNSLYSSPDPNVPDATVTGLFHSTPAIFTRISITVPPPSPKIPVRLCRHVCYEHDCGDPLLWTDRRIPDMRQLRRPFFLPSKCNTRSCSLLHTA